MKAQTISAQSPDRFGWAASENLHAEARGSYHPFRFLVRLRQDMYERLEQHPGGTSSGGDLALLDAFSTYLHETLHWWQHIGTTTGLLLSLSPPMQSHINYNHLKLALEMIGARKPLIRLTEGPSGSQPAETEECLNRIVNNWHDLEFNRRILLDPTTISGVLRSPYFESQGHAISIGLGNLLLLLGATFDSGHAHVPHPRNWEDAFASLRDRRVEGYCFGSTVRTTELGAVQIFEGQARFSQLQYLYLTTNAKMSWQEFRDRGMLGGIYVQAFNKFLTLTGWGWPSTPVSAEVLLFLLVCDLAINPSDGYPFDIRHFESLIESVDPGIRFGWFCSQLARQPALRDRVAKCDRDGYLEVAQILCKSIVCETPVGIAQELIKWTSQAPGFRELLEEESSFAFSEANLPVRVAFGKHLRFAQQRLRKPEFFCWPAMFLTERSNAEVNLHESLEIFHMHQPPFLAHPSGEIRPALFQGVSEAALYETFNSFYRWVLVYDLINQWTVRDGPYDLDFTWMHPLYTPTVTKPFAERSFVDHFGISLDSFHLVS